MLMCTVLTFAMCADPNVPAAFVFGDLTVPIVWSHVRSRSCMDAGAQSSDESGGLARFETAWISQETPVDGDGYAGHIVVHIDDARIEMNAFSWDRMSRADTDALRRAYRATLWHEIGHLRTAAASVAAANAEGDFSAATAAEYAGLAKMHGNAAVARIDAEQTAYDRAAAHGLRQHTLPPPLGGPDTIVSCPSR